MILDWVPAWVGLCPALINPCPLTFAHLEVFLETVPAYLGFTMTLKLKPDITHTDVLGQNLKVDDFVAYPSSSGLGRNQLKVGKIVAFTPMMVKVVHLKRRSVYETKVTTRYPNDCIRLDDQLMTLYLLKNHGID